MKRAVQSLIILIAIAMIAGLIMLYGNRPKKTVFSMPTIAEPQPLRFGIFGAVKTPGLFESSRALRVEDAIVLAGGMTAGADESMSGLTRWVNDGDTVIIPTRGAVQATLTVGPTDPVLVNLNSASVDELMTLPGVGEKKAKDIIELRTTKNGFQSVDELLEIPGIGEKTLQRFIDLLIIE